MNGTDLLSQFKESRSEEAFRQLVRRYTNLVYSVAKRRVSDSSLAQEVTQLVFIRLAKAAPSLRGDAELTAWLHRTTVNASIDLWRSESRHRAREEQAVAMQAKLTEDETWTELAPELDEALNQLNDADRRAILLRFFDEKSMRDLGALFGVSEDAAKMRVSRALDRLREQLSTRGVACGAVTLGTMLTDRAIEAAPTVFAAALATFGFPISASLSTSGLVAALAQLSRTKVVAGVAGVIVIGAVSLVLLRSQSGATRIVQNTAAETVTSNSPQNQQLAVAAADGGVSDAEREPDPLKLLLTVARARQQITSGSMELQLTSAFFGRQLAETNEYKLGVLFDGRKRHFDETVREYAYTLMGDASAAQEAQMREQRMDREAAVRAGLLEGFTAHYVSVYDDNTYLKCREHGQRSESTTIEANTYSSPTFMFDPRCLGLRTLLYSGQTVENCLGYNDAKSIQLVAKEFVDTTPAWHVHVLSKQDESLDFWIDVAHPERVLKQAKGRDVVVVKYNAGDPIPIEVSSEEFRNGNLFSAQRFTRSNAKFNIPVDPASFTLAGLGMNVGTPVTDIRIHRSIGYWTGAGLAEFPPKKGAEAHDAPSLTGLVAILENDPSSQEGLDAAAWILLNTPDGPEVEAAASVILRYHVKNPNLEYLSERLEHVRHRCAKKLLEAILDRNPNPEVQATACFSLATLLKDDGDFGKNKRATDQAEKLFARIVSDFSQSKPKGFDLARKAKPLIAELRRLVIGKPAPDFEGEDLEGRNIKLSDYRGKVVVVAFWYSSTVDTLEEHRKFLDRLDDKSFAYLTINCDSDIAKAKTAIEKAHIAWPTIYDGRSGPISADWNINLWTSVFILDRRGVIRHRQLRGKEFVDAVEALLREGT